MRRKRNIVVVSILILISLILTACGSKDAQAAPDTDVETGNTTPLAISQVEITPAAVTPPVTTDAAATSQPEPKVERSCTISISCATILDNLDKLDSAKEEVLPEDGMIMTPRTVTLSEGDSVFDILSRETRSSKIHMESVEVPAFKTHYIEGIGNIYEFDCGELSGWMYKVNGVFPNYSSSKQTVSDGDVIEWIFSCDLGRDIGAYEVDQKQ